MRPLLGLALLVALAVWAWRKLVAGREPEERAVVSYADGSSLLLEPGTAGFERLAGIARGALVTATASGSIPPS